MRGAEAVLRISRFVGKRVVIKERIKKNYREMQLDIALRIKRTKQEARLLHKAKIAGVPCPVVLAINDFAITMTYINGKRPKDEQTIYRDAGTHLALLHTAGIIHGDYTPANLLINHGKLVVIDFGLGFFSNDIEDKGIDVLTMLKTLNEKCKVTFLNGYKRYEKYAEVMKRIEQIKSRVRYA